MAWSSAIAALAIIFSFQNCQKAPHADEISSSGNTAAGSSSSKIDLASESIHQIDFIIVEKETVTRAGRTFDLMVNKTLEINLRTGAFDVVSDFGGVAVKKCLTEDLKNELTAILKTAKICKIAATVTADHVCTQSLKLPYAEILTDVGQYGLIDGGVCGEVSNELCGEHKTLLKGFIASLKTQYKNLNCAL